MSPKPARIFGSALAATAVCAATLLAAPAQAAGTAPTDTISVDFDGDGADDTVAATATHVTADPAAGTINCALPVTFADGQSRTYDLVLDAPPNAAGEPITDVCPSVHDATVRFPGMDKRGLALRFPLRGQEPFVETFLDFYSLQADGTVTLHSPGQPWMTRGLRMQQREDRDETLRFTELGDPTYTDLFVTDVFGPYTHVLITTDSGIGVYGEQAGFYVGEVAAVDVNPAFVGPEAVVSTDAWREADAELPRVVWPEGASTDATLPSGCQVTDAATPLAQRTTDTNNDGVTDITFAATCTVGDITRDVTGVLLGGENGFTPRLDGPANGLPDPGARFTRATLEANGEPQTVELVADGEWGYVETFTVRGLDAAALSEDRTALIYTAPAGTRRTTLVAYTVTSIWGETTRGFVIIRPAR